MRHPEFTCLPAGRFQRSYLEGKNQYKQLKNSARTCRVSIEHQKANLIIELRFLGKGATTLINTMVNKGHSVITIEPTKGDFEGFVKNNATSFVINVTAPPENVEARIGGKNVKLKKAKSTNEFDKLQTGYFYDATPNLNQFATKGSEFEKVVIAKNPQLLVKLASTDVTVNDIFFMLKVLLSNLLIKIEFLLGH